MKSKSLGIGQYPMELVRYFRNKPWDNVTLNEVIAQDETGLIEKSCGCSIGIHDKTFRHDGQPARKHPLKVFKILVYYGVYDPYILAAAFLHDGPEDNSDLLLIIFRDGYPERVYRLVKGVTRLKGMTKQEHFALVDEDFDTIIIKLADRLHNLRNMAKNLYINKKFTKERLRNYVAETIEFVYPLGEKISWSNYKYARAGVKIYDEIKKAVMVSNILLEVPRRDIMLYQRSRGKLESR